MPRNPVPEDRILDAASDLFSERGYRGTATTAIAERAGINEVTLFRRFGNKRGILAALARRWTEGMAGLAVDAYADSGDVRGTIAALARLEFDGAEQYGAAAMRLAMEAPSVPDIQEAMGASPHDNLAGLAAYLRERQEDGSVRADLSPWVMADAFFAMTSTQLIARQMLRLPSPGDLPTDVVVEQLVELYCAGILAEGVAR